MRTTDPAHSPSIARRLSPDSISSRLFRLIVLAVFACLLAADASAADFHGRVIAVADGDTITVVDAAHAVQKVRLAGIDAPERSQPYGAQARKHLVSLVLGKAVRVIWHKRDRYGRLVGEVRLPVRGACGRSDCAGIEDVGLAQVESGFAWHYKQYQNEQSPEDRSRYALAEQQARARREGLWQAANPMPPWEYRNGHRAAVDARTDHFEAPDRFAISFSTWSVISMPGRM